ncbi:hypothetical protein PISMIDRAFT_12189 [Pisolithus microcarpus 441]|uniref:Uncharacterized protein n=1 Tax=Pisolithus microcarpus 441 TaxID=765257 RepID=A0A0C9YXU1_9AGAM|nr:hypothetical protein BKA83DRAFT_12189 [Pisolithus microcarpus]KIK21561.1 hypothetical protein PISMIDRAFT_12189 [Pisolithus microcarpus 441]
MFYETCKELDITVENIMVIYHRLIGAMKNLGPKERFNSWKEAVKAISAELPDPRKASFNHMAHHSNGDEQG